MAGIVVASQDRKTLAAEIALLERETREKLRGRLIDLRLELQRDGVVLHGTARSFYAKQLAQHAVLTGTELPILCNKIKVLTRKRPS